MSVPVDFRPDCEPALRALWDYLARELDKPQLAAIDAHLAECEHCRAHADFEQRLIDEIRALRREHSDPADLRQRVLQTIRIARASRG